MTQRVRDIHGKFVTVEQLAAQQEAKKSKYLWVDPEIVFEVPKELSPNGRTTGYKLVRLTDQDDLNIWARHDNHCGMTHYKWCTIERIWHFFTVIAPDGEPHGSWHLKDVESLGKVHQDDAKATFIDYRGRPDGTLGYWGDYGKTFTASTNYNGPVTLVGGQWQHATTTFRGCKKPADWPTGQTILDNKPVILVTPYTWDYADPKYRRIFKTWYDLQKGNLDGPPRAA